MNSLLDAFNKPFMVGGLRRADGTARPATDLTATKEMSTSDRIAKEAGRDAPSPRQATVNGSSGRQNDDTLEQGRAESPEWPSDVEDGDEGGEEEPVARGREKVPSRSPPPTNGNGEVWHDPLDDGDDDEDGVGDEGAPPTKRVREA